MPETDAILAAGFSETPWWWRDAPPGAALDAPSNAPLKAMADALDTAAVDVAVIGGGYTGLSCALELARAGATVSVLDADALGAGASTRNAGFVSGRGGVSKQIALDAAVGRERAERILSEADEAFEHFQQLIASESIACDFEPVGRFVAAHTPHAYDKPASKAEEYNRDGRDLFRMVPRAEQQAYVSSTRYHGGMFIENAGSIHPARYHAGLLASCRAAGVRLYPETRALAIAVDGARRQLATSRGVITAREIVLATNGYTGAVSPWHQRRIMPISSTIVASERLDEERIRGLLPAGCAVIDSKRVIFFARPSPDHRHILFGGRARFAPIGPIDSARILHRQMCDVFPDLAGIKVLNVWSGFMAFTFDFLPKLGIHDGVHYAMGCNGGCGIVMMSWLGREVARTILGNSNRDSAFAGLEFAAPPFYSGRPWFVPIVGSWYRLRDWIELRMAARAG